MTIKGPTEKIDRKLSVNPKIKKKKTCFSSTTQSGIQYAIAWIAYVLIGSWIFLVLEKTTGPDIAEHHKWTKFKDLLTDGRNVVHELHILRRQLLQLCPHDTFNTSFEELLSSSDSHRSTGNPILKTPHADQWIQNTEAACKASLTVVGGIVSHPKWSFVDAVYYTMTLVTTIGFGHIYPTTDPGKIFSVLFAIVGVPLTCLFITKNSDMLSNKMLHLYESTKKKSARQPKTILYGVTWIFLILGCLVFMYLPSLAFAAIEDWSYVDSIYFTFITLSTIGFGEYIAGYNGKPENETYSDIYKILIVVWIMVALGYWILLLNFLQKAIKSNAKNLKKKFKSKNITKQAEFLRQLIAKVKQQSDSTIDNEARLQMMAMMVESLTSKSSFRKSSASLYNVKPSLSRLSSIGDRSVSDMDTTIRIESSEIKKPISPIKFKDLMKIKVSLETEALPEFKSLVSEAGNKQSFGDYQQFIQQENFGSTGTESRKLPGDLTLPLRDVIGVILLVASLDEDCQNDNEDDEEEDSHSDDSSPIPIVDPRECVPLLKSIFLNQDDNEDDEEEDSHSDDSSPIPIVDPRECVPLLKSIFLNQDDYEDTDPKAMTLHEKETIKNAYFESALNHYLEECEEVSDKNFDLSDDENIRRKNNIIG